MYSGYTLLWWPRVYIAGAYLYHYTLCNLDTHCYGDPGYTLLVLIYISIIPYVLWIYIVMMTLGIHCWCLSISLLYLMYPGYTLLWWHCVYIAGAFLYHYYSLCTLDTHCYDDPGFTLLVIFYINIIAYVPWIHIAMMTLGIHFWCLSISLLQLMYPGYTLLCWPWVYIAGAFSISLYLMVPRYTLLWWPRVYIAGAYLYHYYTLWSLDTHCYDDPGYTFLVLIYITIIDYVPWIHIVMMTLGIHCWRLSISLF